MHAMTLGCWRTGGSQDSDNQEASRHCSLTEERTERTEEEEEAAASSQSGHSSVCQERKLKLNLLSVIMIDEDVQLVQEAQIVLLSPSHSSLNLCFSLCPASMPLNSVPQKQIHLPVFSRPLMVT